jgi:hypothetical protein
VRLKLKPREIVLLSLVVVAAVLALWPRFQGSGNLPRPRARAQAQESLPPVPRIDLARLEQMGSEAEVGRRDLFAYGPLRSRTDDALAPMPEFERAPSTAPPPVERRTSRGDSSGSGLPPMNLKFIGSVGNAEGVKVAVLITERNEVLTGQAGEVIANRYRIEKIGIESVDLEDVSSGQSRRIPLKGD